MQEFIGSRERLIDELVRFVCSDRAVPADRQPTAVLAWIIELLGISITKSATANPELPSFRDPRSQFGSLVQTLAARGDRESGHALDKLASNRELRPWRCYLRAALDRQRALRRDAEYRHPSADEICKTLSGGAPANAGDLAALVTDLLSELARVIRTGNTDDWRQYWNEPSDREPTPKHEDHCRDALLSDLRHLLPRGVDAQPEGQYANDKRADIRIAYRDFQAPVEIKKNGHRDLWRAARTQLIAQYTIDPATGGHGIYVVLWFGGYTQPPASGALPADPSELENRLKESLTDQERRRISVVVIDVSRPG